MATFYADLDFDQDTDRDSDHVDTDVENELYSQIYHQTGEESDKRCGSVLIPIGTETTAVVPEATCDSSLQSKKQAISRKFDIVTISSDSESEPSKSRMIGQKRKWFSSSDTLTSLSSVSDEDDDILFIPNVAVDVSSLIVPSISGGAAPSRKEPLNASSNAKQSTSVSKALSGFLNKCRPDFVPGGLLQTYRTPKKVSLDLLNSLPGNNNRFKKIKLDPGEDPALWRMDSADSPQAKHKQRYYAGGQKQVACFNCREYTDHVARHCPKPRPRPTCYVCGQCGHLGHSCRNVICGKCFKKGHLATSCAMPVAKVTCSECKFSGHSYSDCPNHWRKYCTTTTVSTSEDPQPEIVPQRRASCSNCCASDHFAFECQERLSDMFPHSTPFLKSKHKSHRSRRASSRKGDQRVREVETGRSASTSSAVNSSPVSANFSDLLPSSPTSFTSAPLFTDLFSSPFEGLRAAPSASNRPAPSKRKRTATATATRSSPHSNGDAYHSKRQAADPNSAKQKHEKQVKKFRQKQKQREKQRRIQLQQNQTNSSVNRAKGKKGKRKENVFTCPDGRKATWKELWTTPANGALGNNRPSASSLVLSVKPEFKVKLEIKNHSG